MTEAEESDLVKIIIELTHAMDEIKVKTFYRGKCGECGKSVYHAYPWFNKNPERYKDAMPYHDDCAKLVLCSMMN